MIPSGKTFYRDNPHWKDFFPAESFIRYLEDTIEEAWIPLENAVEMHLDIYKISQTAPTIVYCHGLSSCGRMMANMARLFFEKGYNVICPDLPGFGLTTQKRGSSTITDMVAALLKAVEYAKTISSGPTFLTGISLGGSLSYYTAASGADVAAIACLNLMDLSEVISHKISHRSQLLKMAKPFLSALASITPEAPLPFRYFVSAQKLCKEERIINTFLSNPLAIRQYTLKAALSLMTAKPAIPFEQFDQVPVLVLHGEEDALIREEVSKNCFDRIKGPKKYVSLPHCEHIPLNLTALTAYSSAVDRWFCGFKDFVVPSPEGAARRAKP